MGATTPHTAAEAPRAIAMRIEGIVQGVGFRPWVYRLAHELGLCGWVTNTAEGVFIEVEGLSTAVAVFTERLPRELPPLARIDVLDVQPAVPQGRSTFEIRSSQGGGEKRALILPDMATCADCLREINDPRDRRYRYPFTNCTHCGPRFTIIEALPYDRTNTSMKRFEMCAACRAEYEDPADRRFHAQPNACPACGPRTAYWDANGRERAHDHAAIQCAAEVIRRGGIVAVKGVGGFHLFVDARDADAVRRLRRRKRRDAKPLAVMAPDLDAARELCALDVVAETLLQSPQAPIVLAPWTGAGVAPDVAPGNPWLGVMLPYTPLHHLLMGELAIPVVATSGNLSDEPICTDEQEALVRLANVADAFLVHDRPIVRHVDDSVVRFMMGGPVFLRRARGYAPAPVYIGMDGPDAAAFGGHLKNTVAVAKGRAVFLSQHLGDLETPVAAAAFDEAAGALPRLYEAAPAYAVHDRHPDYYSTRHAQSLGLPCVPVQHHYAHVAGCMAEHNLAPPLLGVAWDGTGLGDDGTIWGGEFLHVTPEGYARVAHLRPFLLPGGDKAAREPRRCALALLRDAYAGEEERVRELTDKMFQKKELDILLAMLDKGLNSPVCTSAGRLFDGVAALCGLRLTAQYEGQAAMELEFAAEKALRPVALPFPVTDAGAAFVLDWRPLVRAAVEAKAAGAAAPEIAAGFHRACAAAIAETAERCALDAVAVSGGCFQNKMLLEQTVEALQNAGRRAYWPRQAPANDGGLALGQIAAARADATRGRRGSCA